MQDPNPLPIKRTSSQYYLLNRKRIREQQHLYYQLNKDKLDKKTSIWVKQNPQKVKVYRQNRLQKYPEIVRAQKAAYKRRLKNQMPLWADKNKILEFYLKAQKEGLTVDHVIPLKGELVSGLHVETNLQLLSKTQNSSKRNKYDLGV